MKLHRFLLFVLIVAPSAFARVGPDLSDGVDVAFFSRLRKETAAKEGYESTWNINEQRIAIVNAYKKGEIDTVLKLADAWLTNLPIDADVHLMVAMAYKEKGDLASYCQHLCIFNGLLASITSSGDGSSKAQAFNVVAVDEEYSLVQEIGGRVTKQQLLGHFDRLEVERKGGKQLVLFFDISVHLRALKRSLGQ